MPFPISIDGLTIPGTAAPNYSVGTALSDRLIASANPSATPDFYDGGAHTFNSSPPYPSTPRGDWLDYGAAVNNIHVDLQQAWTNPGMAAWTFNDPASGCGVAFDDGFGGVGTPYDDVFAAEATNNSSIENINGSNLADTIKGDVDNNIFNGNDGADTLEGRDGNDSIQGDAGSDSIDGGNGGDMLRGDDGKDTLIGGDGDDTLLGDSRNDLLVPGFGADYLSGGADVDTVDYSYPSAVFGPVPGGVIVNLAARAAIDPWGFRDSLDDVENVVGTNFADVLFGNFADGRLDGLGGNDTLEGLIGNDTLTGGLGADRFVFVKRFLDDGVRSTDTLMDFSALQGDKIVIELPGGTFTNNIRALGVNRYAIDWDGGGNITTDDVIRSNVALNSGDFMFVDFFS